MQETLHDYHTSISSGGRPIRNLRIADGVELMGGSNGELQDLTNRLVNRATAYGLEVSTTIGTNNISTDVSMNGQKLEVTSFKYP